MARKIRPAGGEAQPDNRAKPALANISGKERCINGELVMSWFEGAVHPCDPKPGLEACNQLARDIVGIVNRQNNFEHARRGSPITEFRNVSLLELESHELAPVIRARNHLIAELLKFESRFATHIRKGDGYVSIDELIEDLYALEPGVSAPRQERVSTKAGGRSEEAWHTAGRLIAAAVTRTLREAGHRKRLSVLYPESPVVITATATINYAYGLHIKTSGFVSAMRSRRRHSAGDSCFFDRHPWAKNIKIG